MPRVVLSCSLACDGERLAGDASRPEVCVGDVVRFESRDVAKVQAPRPVSIVDSRRIRVDLTVGHELKRAGALQA